LTAIFVQEALFLSRIPDMVYEKVKALEERIGYKYKNKNLAINALVHSSFSNENHNFGFPSNERLEFLGDAILDFVLGLMLYNNKSNFSEGQMSKMRALIVCEASLNNCAKKLNLGELILLGKGEEASGGRERPSILSDAVEAIIGSIYLDGGMEEAEKFIRRILTETYEKAVNGILFMDYKTALQEELQKSGDVKIEYKLIDSYGPDHSKTFKMSVYADSRHIGTGTGKSKKEAEQMAAKAALDEINQEK